MRHVIQANMHGKGFEDCEPQTYQTDDRGDAETLFRFLLDAGIRPVRLFDMKGEHMPMKAENGIRTGC